jgi:hypothetical protein
MLNARQQPEVIPVGKGMAGQWQEYTTAQVSEIALPFGDLFSPATALTRTDPRVYAELSDGGNVPFGLKSCAVASSKSALSVGKDHAMAGLSMLEVVVNFFLGTQTLEKLQIRFSILGAIVPRPIVASELKAKGTLTDTVLTQHPTDNFGHRKPGKDSLVETLRQTRQLRPQAHATEP